MMSDEIKEVLTKAEEKFEYYRQTIGFFLGPVIFLILFFLPLKLSPEAHMLSAIFGLVLIYWISEAIPIPVTALLGAFLAVIFKVAPTKEVFAFFADPIIFLFIGSFILAQAMTVHNLDKRIAYTLLNLKWVNTPKKILIVYGGVTAFISMWISNTAATAIMFPIGLGILKGIKSLTKDNAVDKKNFSSYATALMLIAAYASSIGGLGTPIGTPPNIIGIGMINKFLNIKITFFQWMLFGIPLLLIMFAVLVFILSFKLNLHLKNESSIREFLQTKKQNLGKITRGEINVLIAFLTAIFLWILPGIIALIFSTQSNIYKNLNERLPEGVVALIAATLLFILPLNIKKREFTLSWKEAVNIDWGTIILFGGGLALGSLMFSTKLAETIGTTVINITGTKSLWGITLTAIALGIIVSETTSNTASANMIIPVMIAAAQSANINPLFPALGACLGASFGFMLPVSTPPNAIVYGSGLVPVTKMAKTGIIFDVCGLLIIFLILKILVPVLF